MEFNLQWALFKNNDNHNKIIQNIRSFHKNSITKINSLKYHRTFFRFNILIKNLNWISDNCKNLGFQKLSQVSKKLVNYIHKNTNNNQFYVWDYIDREIKSIIILYNNTFDHLENCEYCISNFP